MGGRSSSFRAKKSGGGLNKKENVEKATNGAGLDNNGLTGIGLLAGLLFL